MNYKRSKYFTTSNKRKIKYLYIKKKSQITIVFFHGFMSDMIGAKPTAIQKFCKKRKLNFLKFEYSGHGKSTGKFIEGNIFKWTNEAKQLIKSKTKKVKNLIFIGSSMGSWIALNLFPFFKKKNKRLYWYIFSPRISRRTYVEKIQQKNKKNNNE